MKIIINLISTYLVTNSLISLFFLRNQKKELDFQQDGDLVFLFIVYSESNSFSKACRIQLTFIKGFSYMLFLLVL